MEKFKNIKPIRITTTKPISSNTYDTYSSDTYSSAEKYETYARVTSSGTSCSEGIVYFPRGGGKSEMIRKTLESNKLSKEDMEKFKMLEEVKESITRESSEDINRTNLRNAIDRTHDADSLLSSAKEDTECFDIDIAFNELKDNMTNLLYTISGVKSKRWGTDTSEKTQTVLDSAYNLFNNLLNEHETDLIEHYGRDEWDKLHLSNPHRLLNPMTASEVRPIHVSKISNPCKEITLNMGKTWTSSAIDDDECDKECSWEEDCECADCCDEEPSFEDMESRPSREIQVFHEIMSLKEQESSRDKTFDDYMFAYVLYESSGLGFGEAQTPYMYEEVNRGEKISESTNDAMLDDLNKSKGAMALVVTKGPILFDEPGPDHNPEDSYTVLDIPNLLEVRPL